MCYALTRAVTFPKMGQYQWYLVLITNFISEIQAINFWEYGKPGMPEQPGSAGTDKFLRRGHVQAAIINTNYQTR